MKLKNYLLYTFLYILIMAISMTVMYHGLGIRYETPQMNNFLIFAEIVLSLLILYYIRRYASWREVGFGKFKWVNVLWIAPTLLLSIMAGIVALTTFASSSPDSSALLDVVLLGVLTLLVGFAEETMFRGILLRGAMTRYNVLLAMLISAIGFSLLHGVNFLGGKPLDSVPSQMTATFVDGLFMAPMAILTGSLIPLILAHFLWDFIQLIPLESLPGPLVTAQILTPAVNYIMMVVGWVVVFVRWRQGKLTSTEPEN